MLRLPSIPLHSCISLLNEILDKLNWSLRKSPVELIWNIGEVFFFISLSLLPFPFPIKGVFFCQGPRHHCSTSTPIIPRPAPTTPPPHFHPVSLTASQNTLDHSEYHLPALIKNVVPNIFFTCTPVNDI